MIYDELEALRIKLQAFIVSEQSGLDYDRATSWCSDCPERGDDDWTHRKASKCCKEYDDYQEKEIEAIQSLKDAVKAINKAKKYFGVEEEEDDDEKLPDSVVHQRIEDPTRICANCGWDRDECQCDEFIPWVSKDEE